MKNKQVKNRMDGICWEVWQSDRLRVTNELINDWYRFQESGGNMTRDVNTYYISLSAEQLKGK